MNSETPPTTSQSWRERMRIIIFEADTRAGKIFDVGLLLAIGLSIAAVVLESVSRVNTEHQLLLRRAEWGFTGLFSLEYILRLIAVPRPVRYARSFFGIVDLLSILPSFVSLVIPGSQSMLVIRALRLLRVFRGRPRSRVPRGCLRSRGCLIRPILRPVGNRHRFYRTWRWVPISGLLPRGTHDRHSI